MEIHASSPASVPAPVMPSLLRRVFARVLDAVVLAPVFLVFGLGAFFLKNPALGIACWFVQFALVLAYEGLMLQRYGATLGKRWMRIEVVTVAGARLDAEHAWRRVFISNGVSSMGMIVLQTVALAGVLSGKVLATTAPDAMVAVINAHRWLQPCDWASQASIFANFLVAVFRRDRRAGHDLFARTKVHFRPAA